MLILLTENCTK